MVLRPQQFWAHPSASVGNLAVSLIIAFCSFLVAASSSHLLQWLIPTSSCTLLWHTLHVVIAVSFLRFACWECRWCLDFSFSFFPFISSPTVYLFLLSPVGTSSLAFRVPFPVHCSSSPQYQPFCSWMSVFSVPSSTILLVFSFLGFRVVYYTLLLPCFP